MVLYHLYTIIADTYVSFIYRTQNIMNVILTLVLLKIKPLYGF